MVEAPEPHWPPIWTPWTPWVLGRGAQPDQITLGMIPYNICVINSPSISVTWAPEGHGAQIHPALDLGSEKVACPH